MQGPSITQSDPSLHRRVCAAALCLWLAACGGGGGGAEPAPDAAPVTLQAEAAQSATIGSSGGSLVATAADGTRYTLEVPPDALLQPVTIRMTPVAAIREPGLSGGLAGAVELQPSGLAFARPALLRVQTSRTAGAGLRLFGFAASGDFSHRELAVAAADADEALTLVSHFSIAGAGFGTTEDASRFASSESPGIAALQAAVLALATPWDDTRLAEAEALARQAAEDIVVPGLRDAADDAQLVAALAAYEGWRVVATIVAHRGEPPIAIIGSGENALVVPPALHDADTTARLAAGEALRRAARGNIDVCDRDGSVQALKNVFFWQRSAQRLGVASEVFRLDDDTLVAEVKAVCARVGLVDHNVPDTLATGQQLRLELNFALHRVSAPRVASDFRVDLAASGLAIANAQGGTGDGSAGSPLGFYTTDVTVTDGSAVALRADVCWVISDRVPPAVDPNPRRTPLCERFVLAQSGPPQPEPDPEPEPPPPFTQVPYAGTITFHCEDEPRSRAVSAHFSLRQGQLELVFDIFSQGQPVTAVTAASFTLPDTTWNGEAYVDLVVEPVFLPSRRWHIQYTVITGPIFFGGPTSCYTVELTQNTLFPS